MTRLAELSGGRADQHGGRLDEPMLDDAAEEAAHAEEDGRQVCSEGVVPLGQAHLVNGDVRRRPVAGIGDEHFDRAKLPGGFGEQAVHLVLVGQIRRESDALRPKLAHQGLRTPGISVVMGRDPRPRPRTPGPAHRRCRPKPR